MAQILDPIPSGDSDAVLCCYVNATSKIQVARITNIPDWYFERVVFPGQRLMFEAVKSAMLEIHTGMMASAILSDTIPCKRLMVEAIADEATPPEEIEEDPDCLQRPMTLADPAADSAIAAVSNPSVTATTGTSAALSGSSPVLTAESGMTGPFAGAFVE